MLPVSHVTQWVAVAHHNNAHRTDPGLPSAALNP